MTPDTDAGERGGMTGPTVSRMPRCRGDLGLHVAKAGAACDERARAEGRLPRGSAVARQPASWYKLAGCGPRSSSRPRSRSPSSARALPRAQMSTEQEAARRLAQAKRLAERAPLIDGHNDIPWRMREQKPRYDFDVFDLRQHRPGVPHRHRPAPRRRHGRRVLVGLRAGHAPGRVRRHRDARADRHGAGDAAPLSRRVRGGPHRRRRRADRQGRPHRLDDGDGGRPLHRPLARGAAACSPGWASAT